MGMSDLTSSLAHLSPALSAHVIQDTPEVYQPPSLVSPRDLTGRLGHDTLQQFEAAIAEVNAQVGHKMRREASHHAHRVHRGALRRMSREVMNTASRRRLVAMAQQTIAKASEGHSALEQWLSQDMDAMERLLVLHAASELAWSEPGEHGLAGEHIEAAIDHLYTEHRDTIDAALARNKSPVVDGEASALTRLQQQAGVAGPHEVMRPAQLCDALLKVHGSEHFATALSQARTDMLQQLVAARDGRQTQRKQLGADTLGLVGNAMAFVNIASSIQVAESMQADLAKPGLPPVALRVPTPVMAKDLLAAADEGTSDAGHFANAWLGEQAAVDTRFFPALRTAVTTLPPDLWGDDQQGHRMQLLESIDAHSLDMQQATHDPLEPELVLADRINLHYHLNEQASHGTEPSGD